MIGFNRRFAPLIIKLKSKITNAVPVAIKYRINAGVLPPEHWIHDRNTGGGRLIGEVCHFIDLCAFLSNSLIKQVTATALKDANNHQDTMVITLQMLNGSIASISYFSNGNKSEGKEFIELYNGGLVARLDDFKSLEIIAAKKETYHSTQDKGHAAGIRLFVNAVETGGPSPVAVEDIFNSMLATFAALDSVTSNGEAINLHA